MVLCYSSPDRDSTAGGSHSLRGKPGSTAKGCSEWPRRLLRREQALHISLVCGSLSPRRGGRGGLVCGTPRPACSYRAGPHGALPKYVGTEARMTGRAGLSLVHWCLLCPWSSARRIVGTMGMFVSRVLLRLTKRRCRNTASQERSSWFSCLRVTLTGKFLGGKSGCV